MKFHRNLFCYCFSILLIALHHAVLKRNYDICEVLLNHKRFNSEARTYEGCSALMIAIMTNCTIEIIELLASKKQNLVLIKNNEEVSPIHEAVKNRRLDVVKCLVEHGAYVNAVDLELEHALHLACSNTDYDMIEYLLNETDINPRAKNCDGVNPLCLLLVRSRNEHQDLVARCFYLLLEHTYDKDSITKTYTIQDIFQCAFLACVYSQTEVVNYLIHNVYSVNNSKYEFIRKLSEYCNGENIEFLYYILVFLHDDIDKYDKFSFPRFYEINFHMCIRSVISIIDMLFMTDEAVELIVTTLEHMRAIKFDIKVREFVDQIGVLLYNKFANKKILIEDIRKLNEIFRFFLEKDFEINSMIKSYLHSIAIAEEDNNFSLESSKLVLQIMIRFTTTFMRDSEHWKQINEFQKLNKHIKQAVEWLVKNFGNYKLLRHLEMNFVFSLKHLCRNEIRYRFKNNPKILCDDKKLKELCLPESLANYISFQI